MSEAMSLGLVLLALASNLIANQTIGGAHLVAGLALVALLALIAIASRLTAAELGLARPTWVRGVQWGGTAAVLVAAGYATAAVIPSLSDAVSEPTPTSWAAVLRAVLIVVPVGTVIPEELAFRGVLWGLLKRRRSELTATWVSSGLFGLWHVLPSLGGGAANGVVVGIVGDGAGGVAVRVVGTVLFTAAAGVVFCWLRARSDSLLAPMLLHWAVNGFGVVFASLD